MFKKFYPNLYVDSTYEIDFEKLYSEGIRGLIFDIDNTLVEHGLPATDRAKALFDRLRSIGFKTCLISNNKEPRVKPFAMEVKSDYVFRANKPSKKNYLKAMDIMNTDKDNTCFVGDQLFTDVYGANRCHIMSILVKPIHPKEEIQIVLKRKLEKIVLHFYKKRIEKNEREN
jgi:HAD superfamily phosphatase (TIGR01668 family)